MVDWGGGGDYDDAGDGHAVDDDDDDDDDDDENNDEDQNYHNLDNFWPRGLKFCMVVDMDNIYRWMMMMMMMKIMMMMMIMIISLTSTYEWLKQFKCLHRIRWKYVLSIVHNDDGDWDSDDDDGKNWWLRLRSQFCLRATID